MKRFYVISLICIVLFSVGVVMITNEVISAGTCKWVIAIKGFCTNGMVKDAKEEMSVGKSDFDQYCKKSGKSKAVDARCRNNNFEVKCR